jgi:hypothetical protein
VAFGQRGEEIDHAAVEQAARMAQLHEFIVGELPASGVSGFLGGSDSAWALLAPSMASRPYSCWMKRQAR